MPTGAPCPQMSQCTLGHFGPGYVFSSLGLSLPISQKKGVSRGSLRWLWSQPKALYVTHGDKDGLLGVAGAKGDLVGRWEPVSPLLSPGLPDQAAFPALSPKFPADGIRLGRKVAPWSEGRAWLGLGYTGCYPGPAQGRWTSPSLLCRYHHTTPVVSLYCLREALALIVEEVRGQAALASAGRAGAPSPAGRCGGGAWTSSATGRLVKPARAARCAEDRTRSQEARSAAVVASSTTPSFGRRGTFPQPLPPGHLPAASRSSQAGAAAWRGQLVWHGNVHTGRRTGHTAAARPTFTVLASPRGHCRPLAQRPQGDQGWRWPPLEAAVPGWASAVCS